MQCLNPSEQLAAGHDIVILLSLAPRFCIIVLEDVLKKANKFEATVREVDLMLTPQCGVR